jgi:hypothetical protein
MEAFGRPGMCVCYLSEFPHKHEPGGGGFEQAPPTEADVIARAAQDLRDAYSLAREFPHVRAYWAEYERAQAEFERVNPILG